MRKGVCILLLSRIKYRYALPLLVTFASLCLFVVSTIQQSSADSRWSLVFKTELLLNLPSVFVVTPIVGLVFENSSDAEAIGLATLLAPLLWFWIGRWVDRKRVTGEQMPHRTRRRVGRTILRSIAYGYLSLCILSFTPLNPIPSQDSNFFFLALAFWLLGYLVCSHLGGQLFESERFAGSNARIKNPT